MIHPLLRLIATQPQLLADHAESYAELLGEELGKSTAVWKRRLLFNAAALCLLGVAAVLAGVALMLWAVTPDANLRAPWALIAGPTVPALLGLWCGFAGRRDPGDGFLDLKQQIAADLVMLRNVSAA
jgi:CBS-domain-containing membrane protein